MYALMYPILYIASIHCYIPLSTATSMSVCSVCIVLWHDHVNGEIKALKKKKKIYIIFSFDGAHISYSISWTGSIYTGSSSKRQVLLHVFLFLTF